MPKSKKISRKHVLNFLREALNTTPVSLRNRRTTFTYLDKTTPDSMILMIPLDDAYNSYDYYRVTITPYDDNA